MPYVQRYIVVKYYTILIILVICSHDELLIYVILVSRHDLCIITLPILDHGCVNDIDLVLMRVVELVNYFVVMV